MSKKQELLTFDILVYEQILRIYDNVIIDDYVKFLGNIDFTKLPKKNYYIQRYIMYLKVSTKLEEFIISDKFNLHDKTTSLRLLSSCLNSTAKWFDYSEEIETALGIYNNKHISIVFRKVNNPK